MSVFRKKGISLLIPTQNVEQTVELCIRSFAEFPDEMIVVDNGSTDNTIEIVKQLEKEYDHLTFYNAPDLKDLYENRQYAFERSNYNWISGIDSDYVAYTSGELNIKNLREKVLNTKRTFPRPTAYGITQVNLFPDFLHTGLEDKDRSTERTYHIVRPMNTLPARIVQWYPGMKYVRLGKWEGIRWQDKMKHIKIKKPYWFHCNFKTKINHLIRFERTNWRKLGDFIKYPTREDYLLEVIGKRYNTSSFEQAANLHWIENVEPFIVEYDENKYYPYPEMIKRKISTNG